MASSPELAHVQGVWDKMKPNSPIYSLLLNDISLVSAASGTITAHLPVLPTHLNSKGTLHGTVSACLVDWAGGMAIASTGRDKTGVSTDIHTSYVGGAKEGEVLEIEGRVSRVGGTMAYTSVEIRKVGGDVVATGLHTKFVRQPWLTQSRGVLRRCAQPSCYARPVDCWRALKTAPRACLEGTRYSSSSSKRWQTRAGNDKFSKEARVQGLKSRAAFKLLEINEKYKLFKSGQTVVDLGYAPGSWSQVAVDRTSPGGRVIGIDIIPAQPPKGVSTIQGNFLAESVQEEVKNFLRDPHRGRLKQQRFLTDEDLSQPLTEEELEIASTDYLELERRAELPSQDVEGAGASAGRRTRKQVEEGEGRMVDVVLSDMCEPWEQTAGFWKKSLSDPYRRMMNTSGNNFRDHAGSMDLCNAALRFGFDTLRTGGHFVCKFYQGVEDKTLEKRLKALFGKVHREKPESSRSESKEAYFVALRRKTDVPKGEVFIGES